MTCKKNLIIQNNYISKISIIRNENSPANIHLFKNTLEKGVNNKKLTTKTLERCHEFEQVNVNWEIS